MVEEIKINNVPTWDILSTLMRQNSKNVSIVKIVYTCYKLRMDEPGDPSQMQVVFGYLHSKGYIFNHRANDIVNHLAEDITRQMLSGIPFQEIGIL
uniref:Uncharacterized protein n=1 Tax=Lactuca sativa TaxID=4236 RepID=A0A9R1WL02_LACSA|nr:hypothetical protein LSAT_V11C100037830 [Lactuca sativa]